MRFGVVSDQRSVAYFVNGIEVHRHPVIGPNEMLYGVWGVSFPGQQISDVGFASAGKAGADGRDGLDGKNGLNGTNGQSIHIAYADSADGTVNFTTGAAGGRTFIGVYTDTNPGADSENPASYGWTRLRGIDGTNGLAGPGGYVHIAYADSADGTANFHLSDPTGRRYLGTYTDQVEPDSTNPARYSWSLIKGADGADGFIVAAIPPFVIPVFPSGTPKTTWTGGSAAIRLFKGANQITAGVTYAVEGATNIVGLTISGQTFSFAGLSSDVGYFTIVATYAGVSYRSRVDVKKLYDGSAAFKANASIPQSTGSTFSGSGTTAVPGGTTVRVSGGLFYGAPNPSGSYVSYQARITLFYRNVSANGPLTALGTVDGSLAYTRNNGSASEPDYEFVDGTVSAAFNFAAPAGDAIFEFSAQVVNAQANPATVTASGSVGLSIVG